MSAELDRLLERMNILLAGRKEGDLGMGDAYWSAKAEYQRALGAANNVHIPVLQNGGVDTVSAGTVAVQQAAAKHAEDLAVAGRALGEAEAKLMLAKAELKNAENRLENSKKPVEDQKTPLELELEAKQRAVDLAEKEAELKRDANNQLRENPPDVDVVFKEAAEAAAPTNLVSPVVSTGTIGTIGETPQEEADENVIRSSGTAPTTTVINPLSGQNPPSGETEAERQLREAGIQ